MTTTLRFRITTALAALIAAGANVAMSAQEKKANARVTGQWTMTVEGTPHGEMTMGLVLEQEGEKVTGTFESPHGAMPVEGEFTHGALSLSTRAEGDAPAITFSAKLTDPDTLAGYLSSSMGDMSWTAKRVKDK